MKPWPESNRTPSRTRFAGGQLHQEPHQGHARPRTDSNRRPPDPESGALSTELQGHGAGGGNRTHSAKHLLYRQTRLSNVGAPTGASDRLRSGFSGATTRRSPIELQTQSPHLGSNQGRPPCEGGAHSAELYGVGGGEGIRTLGALLRPRFPVAVPKPGRPIHKLLARPRTGNLPSNSRALCHIELRGNGRACGARTRFSDLKDPGPTHSRRRVECPTVGSNHRPPLRQSGARTTELVGLVAGKGIEPSVARVMSPASYRYKHPAAHCCPDTMAIRADDLALRDFSHQLLHADCRPTVCYVADIEELDIVTNVIEVHTDRWKRSTAVPTRNRFGLLYYRTQGFPSPRC